MTDRLTASSPLALLSVLFLSLCALAQSPPGSSDKLDYSQEPFIYEYASTTVRAENSGIAARKLNVRVRIQSEAGLQQFGLLRLQYASAQERVAIDFVRVRKPDGTVIATPTERIPDLPAEITRLAPLYSDYMEKHVAVKGLGIGDVLEYQVNWESHTPIVPGHFWLNYNFGQDAIFLEEILEVSFPRNRRVIVKSPKWDPTIIEQEDRRIYTWKTANLERKSTEQKPQTPAVHELPAADVQLTSFESWDEIGQWYGDVQRPRTIVTPEIRTRATELTHAAATDTEKLNVLYQHVATRFRYISLSFGIGSYQPHPAAEVLANQYGDCKDKHTLLASLLAAVGLKAYPALIHSSLKLDPDVPSPAQFDHLITAVPQGDDFLWLDTTTEVAPVGFLPAHLRDKLALVIPDDRPSFLVKTPPDPPFASSQVFQIEGTLSREGTLQSQVQFRARGDLELILRAAFRRTPQPQWKDIVQALSYAWGFGGTVSDVGTSLPEATDAPFSFTYKYKRENFSDWANLRITPALPNLGLPAIEEGREKSEEPIRLGAPGEILYEAKLELPSGFSPELPPGKEMKEDFADYDSTYTFANNILQVERRLTIKAREIAAAAREDYQAFKEAVQGDENTYINIYSSDTSRSSMVAGSSSPEAESLFDQGREALRRRDVRAARDFFTRAVAVDPEFGIAWHALGTVHMMLNDVDSGVAAFRHAIEVNPNNPTAYKALAVGLIAAQRPAEALQTWKQLQEIDPQDRDAPANAGFLLFSSNRYSEAATELETAVKLNPASAHLHLLLGLSHLRAGAEDKALAALRKTVELDPSPVNLNNVAYELAEHSQRFPEVLEYAERAVQLREEETANIQLDNVGAADVELTAQLGAQWDTLGWVYFHLGNLQKAEKYLYAAWNLLQDAEVADHLGQLYERQGRTSAATKAYAWALAAPLGNTRQGTRARLHHLVGSEARVEAIVNQAREELGKMRMFKVGKITPQKASAEFFILFSVGPKVEGVKFISGADELRQATEAVASAKYDVPFPDDGPTKLLRRAMLFCSGGTSGCELVLYTPERPSSSGVLGRPGLVRF